MSAPGTNTPPVWSWQPYPATSNMCLGMLPCRIQPRTSFTIAAPLAGPLRVYVSQTQTNLPAGFVWAEFEPKILSAEATALEDTKTRFNDKERMLYELDLPRQKLKLQRDIEEAQRQVVLLELLIQNPEVAPTAANMAGLKDRSIRPESLERAKAELELLQKGYKYLCETNLAVFGTDLRAQEADLQQRSLELERRQTQTRFSMPFAGQLNVSLPLLSGVSDYPVNLGQEIAVVRDLGAILLRVPLVEPAWSSLPAERLSAVISLPDGEKLRAAYAFKRLEHPQFREEIVYYFQFPETEAAQSIRLIGADMSCEIWLTLPEPAHIVPKLALVLQAPAAFQNRQWDQGLARLSPGAHLLVEGQNDLAILAR